MEQPRSRSGALDLEGLCTSDLIDLILNQFHDTHRRELPELVGLAQKVERVHHDVVAVPRGLSAALKRLSIELDMHMRKEEEVLFPAMRHGLTEAIAQPITAMRRDHDDHVEALSEIDRLTNGLRIPEGVCGSWQRLYAGLGKLRNDLTSHMAAENDMLFPRFELGTSGCCICANK